MTSITHRITPAVVALALLIGGISIAQTPKIDPLEDARQKFSAGQYQPALQAIAAELSRTRPTNPRDALPSAQRYALLMLRGECLLRIDQRASAADSFTQAEKSSTEPQEFALARANSMLAKASPNNKFTPRGGPTGSSFDILDTEARKSALNAMREEKLAALNPRLDRAKSATTLPPMFEVLDPLLDITALEYAANGNAIQTRVTLMDLGTSARNLINDELKRLSTRLNALDDAASSIVGGVGTGFVGRRGLYSNEAAEVREMIPYLGQIEKTARDVRVRAQKLGFQAEAWEPIVADTADMIDRAQAMLNISP